MNSEASCSKLRLAQPQKIIFSIENKNVVNPLEIFLLLDPCLDVAHVCGFYGDVDGLSDVSQKN